jgi:hypothetical protein
LPRSVLLSTRRFCELRVGLVARRIRGMKAAAAISSRRRSSAAKAVALQAAVLLGLDHHDTVGADALVLELQQAQP